MKKVMVFDSDKQSGPPETLGNFREWLDEIIDSIPEEHQAGAHIVIESRPCYDSAEHSLEIWYMRPKTEQEKQEDASKELAMQERRKADELRTLAALQAKYGSMP